MDWVNLTMSLTLKRMAEFLCISTMIQWIRHHAKASVFTKQYRMWRCLCSRYVHSWIQHSLSQQLHFCDCWKKISCIFFAGDQNSTARRKRNLICPLWISDVDFGAVCCQSVRGRIGSYSSGFGRKQRVAPDQHTGRYQVAAVEGKQPSTWHRLSREGNSRWEETHNRIKQFGLDSCMLQTKRFLLFKRDPYWRWGTCRHERPGHAERDFASCCFDLPKSNFEVTPRVNSHRMFAFVERKNTHNALVRRAQCGWGWSQSCLPPNRPCVKTKTASCNFNFFRHEGAECDRNSPLQEAANHVGNASGENDLENRRYTSAHRRATAVLEPGNDWRWMCGWT